MQASLIVFTVLFAGSALAAWPAPDPKCPKNWTTYNGTRCLSLFTKQEPWEEARNQCKFDQPGADLAVVDTEEKKSFVHTMVHANPPFLKCGLFGMSVYWIGAHDAHKEGRFEWLDTFRVVDYTNWALFEPNDNWSEDCVEMQYEDGKWNDEDCEKERCFVCEKPVD